jgi:hypothetical protein
VLLYNKYDIKDSALNDFEITKLPILGRVLVEVGVFSEDDRFGYLYSTGFWQYWNMFSPNPANVDVYMDALVTYQDGTQMQFEYPVMQHLSVWERYFKERYRKFVENVHPDRFAYKWPSVAQAIAYQSYKGDGNLPKIVTLRRHFKTVLGPDEVQDPEYKEYSFFTYMVDTEKLLKQVHG